MKTKNKKTIRKSLIRMIFLYLITAGAGLFTECTTGGGSTGNRDKGQLTAVSEASGEMQSDTTRWRQLFNGKDLTGWRAHEPDKLFGWCVEDGTLKNNTPKTDFSATGAYANLRTEAEFGDFWLHIEFLVGTNR